MYIYVKNQFLKHSKSQEFELQCSTLDSHFQFIVHGLKWNATNNMPRDMAETSVTDFFTLITRNSAIADKPGRRVYRSVQGHQT